MPFSDGSSGVIEKVLLPFDDLNLKEGTVGFLRTPEDVAVHLAVLSAQGPQSPKLLQATQDGNLRVALRGWQFETISLPPVTYGGAAAHIDATLDLSRFFGFMVWCDLQENSSGSTGFVELWGGYDGVNFPIRIAHGNSSNSVGQSLVCDTFPFGGTNPPPYGPFPYYRLQTYSVPSPGAITYQLIITGY